MTFLDDREPRPLADETPAGWSAEALYVGTGPQALEVAVFSASRPPNDGELRKLHDARKSTRAAPVLVVALFGNRRAALGSHDGMDHIVRHDLEQSQVERLCAAALDSPERHAAHRFLAHAFAQFTSSIPGLRNSGLFAMHELQYGVPRRADWQAAREEAREMLALRGRDLVRKLGFAIESIAGPASILVASGTKVAIAVFLERPEQIEPASAQFNQLSPVSYALAKADSENLDYVVVSAGSALRVYPVKPGVGTGRRGRTETYVELDLALLPNESAGYLSLLASSTALVSGGTLQSILDESRNYAVGLGERLRERVYLDVVPQLAKAIVAARRLRDPTTEQLHETYEMALLVLFRLLFVAYAEDKELLPLHSSASYRAHSLKEAAKLLRDEAERDVQYDEGDVYWTKVQQLWVAVERGKTAWNVPAYDGGLFASGESAMPAAQALAELTLSDASFAPPLRALLLDEAEGTLGPIDFRSLGVREFGTIYEGLLEQELSVAETDLAVQSGAYVPAKRNAKVEVREGEVYLHTASGARKSSGSYYTPEFAVEHLLEHALEPALDDHLNRLDAIYTVDARKAADSFFDFHVADIAMGSGHFLVAAIDRIERKLSGYLAKRPLGGVRDELERLRKVAADALGADYAGEPIEDTQLLRRQIARRCIFGVDLNPVAV
ncbi:MAG: Eco57I restriction-modification methylase domain-containing protein, partial [Gemmatimonadaceae bacterium]